MKTIAFWTLDATVLFALSLVYLHQGYQRKNPLFAVWLFNGVLMQLIGAWSLAAGRPPWVNRVRLVDDLIVYVLTVGVLLFAAVRRDCQVNRTLLWGVGAMLVLNLFSRFMGVRLEHSLQVWLRNIAFFGPAIFLLIALSGIRFDLMPLWVSARFRMLGDRWVEGPALAAVGIFESWRSRRQSR
ncbi:MAG TPA: hypothetical protein VG206_11180 [Terriglobia bacterium]|nr:hypothetical protein [Terriglobia bacterium]